MTLNASGPISLGGATTGQSINLELGQSATALASINATNFRTLAGVASGQISISNFYGKSNSFGWISYITGSGNQATTQNAFFADPSGNTYFSYKGGTSADYSAIARVNSSGATATYTRPWADNFLSVNVTPHSSLYTGDANFFACARISDLGGFPFSTLTSSLGYQSGKQVNANGLSYPRTAALTPDGRVYVAGRLNDKYQPSRVICLSTSGTSLGGWDCVISNSIDAAIAPRTDNAAYWIYKSGSFITWETLPAGGGAPINGKQATYAWSDGGYSIDQAATDSSNNLYAVTSQGRLFKVNSAGTSVTGCYPATADSYGSVQVYGSYIYVVTSSSTNAQLYIRAYDTSLTPQWINTFTFSGGSTNISMNRGRFMATAAGLFIMANNNTYGDFILKVPLTGVPSSSSKALTAPSGLTLNWTKSTFTVTSLSFNAPTTNGPMSATSFSPTSSSAYPAGGTTAPANTNTAL